MSREDAGMEHRPHQLRSIEIGDTPESWASAGFTVDDRQVVIGATRLVLTAGGSRGITRVGVDAIESPIDEMPFGPADKQRPDPAVHQNRVAAIDHLVAMSGDIDRTIRALQRSDIELRRERHFGEGATAKRQAFFWLGNVILELAGPATTDVGGAAALWGLALTCDDLDAAKDILGDALSDPKAAVQAGRRIATLRTRELDISVPVAFMSAHPAG